MTGSAETRYESRWTLHSPLLLLKLVLRKYRKYIEHGEGFGEGEQRRWAQSKAGGFLLSSFWVSFFEVFFRVLFGCPKGPKRVPKRVQNR